ncbi:MAG TPA: hypothetical protein VF079_07040 [Sphingomicrobium sp.]
MTPDSAVLEALDRIDAFWQNTATPVFDDDALEVVASSPEAIETLIGIASDETAPLGRRYAAAEAIAQSGATAILAKDAGAARAVAMMLVSAMTRDQIHNRWGLPGYFVGETGKLLLALGPSVPDALRLLQADERPLNIIGSEGATLQHAHRYRIRDLAGYLLAKHQGLPWHDDPDPAVRDRHIGRRPEPPIETSEQPSSRRRS